VSKLVPVFRGAAGINNRVDPVRLRYNPETGISDLAAAVNVDIDDTGRISRRKGFTSRLTLTDPHSLFHEGTDTLFVVGDALAVLNEDYTWTPIRNVTPGLPMAYAQVADRVYYCNGVQRGFVQNAVSYAWAIDPANPLPPGLGDETSLKFYNPPMGTKLAFYASRMWVIQGDTAWYSEPWWYEYFRLGTSYLKFPSQVRMFRPVADGLYVSTDEEVCFVSGTSPQQMILSVVSDVPVMEGTDVKIERVLQDGQLATGAMWVSPKGIYEGFPGGRVRNLTQDKLDLTRTGLGYPVAVSGAAAYWWNGKYLALLAP
jgi:hypothetical protein